MSLFDSPIEEGGEETTVTFLESRANVHGRAGGERRGCCTDDGHTATDSLTIAQSKQRWRRVSLLPGHVIRPGR